MSYQNVKDYRQRLKDRLIYIMGEKCCICGYNKNNSALEFHHLNPTQKDFTLGQNPNISFAKANEEIKKCILVCANCHREIHSGLINVTNIQCYDEIKAKEIENLVEQTKHKQIFYCKDCGKEIWRGSERCPECQALQTRVVERPNREELKNLIRKLPFTTIGRQFNVSDNAIRK